MLDGHDELEAVGDHLGKQIGKDAQPRARLGGADGDPGEDVADLVHLGDRRAGEADTRADEPDGVGDGAEVEAGGEGAGLCRWVDVPGARDRGVDAHQWEDRVVEQVPLDGRGDAVGWGEELHGLRCWPP